MGNPYTQPAQLLAAVPPPLKNVAVWQGRPWEVLPVPSLLTHSVYTKVQAALGVDQMWWDQAGLPD